jgi:glucose/arabinose dehydrogenase
MSFTTGGGKAAENYPIAFEKVEMPGDGKICTSLAIGPDHRLYVGTMQGAILRYDINADGTLGTKQVIDTVIQHNHGPRLITGICFDPVASKEKPILWISHGQLVLNPNGRPSFEGATDWTGKISRVSGNDLHEYRDVIVNLPRSWRDHLNNQIVFGPDRALYWSQSSHTAMGAPDTKWGHRTERLLSAAILRADVRAIDETVDVKTEEGGKYDPFATGAPVRLFATGVRVSFDLLWHSNGYLYAGTNGSAAGANVPGSPEGKFPRRIDQDRLGPYDGTRAPALMQVPTTMDDYLIKVEDGGYYGHPNPTRGEYVLYGGNPTAGADPLEVSAYAQGVKPDRNFRLPVYDFGQHISPNGMIEYRSGAFGGALKGKILVTRFSGGKDILVLTPGPAGEITETISGIAGLSQFQDPLDLVEDPSTGAVYVAEFQGAKLALLRPVTDAAAAGKLSTNVFIQKVQPLGK